MKIQEIYDYQDTAISDINKTAKNIHPKLLSRLSYADIQNDELMDDRFVGEFKECVEPLIQIYTATNKQMCEEFMIQYAQDVGNLFGNIGYNLDDGTIVEVHSAPKIFSMNYFPSSEIVDVWDKVHSSIMYAYSPVPFWKSTSYFVIGPYNRGWVYPEDTPVKYIQIARSIFSTHKPVNAFDEIVRNVRILNSFEYEVPIEPLTKNEEAELPKNLSDSINRHLVLKHVLEKMDTENMGSYNWSVSITPEGEVNLIRK